MSRAGWALVLVLVLGTGAGAQDRLSLVAPEGGEPVHLRADALRASEGGGEVEALGRVTLSWGRRRVTARRLVYRRESGRVEAEGDVTLKDEAGNLLRAERVVLDLSRETGEVTRGILWLVDGGYRVWGERFRKTGPDSYVVEDGGFTTCDGTWPSWRVEADRVEVELEGYLVGRGAAFWVEGVPLVYTPYVLFPVKRERQSGFLIPRVGFSDQDGFLWVQQYYWAPLDGVDLTPRLEYRSRRGWTQGLQVRYAPAEGHRGALEVTHLRDRVDDSHRYTVQADHESEFDPHTRARVHVDYLGDTGYLRDLGETLDERGMERLESFALATRDGGLGTGFGLAEYVQNLDGSQGEVLQTLPAAGLLGREAPLVGPLFYEPTFRATRFWRREGTRGERLILSPGLAADLSLGPMGLAGRAGYREHLYREDEERISRGAARAEAAMGTTVYRTYGSLVHTLEPSVGVFWEEEGRGGEAPEFDRADVFGRRTEVRLLLESRLLDPDLAPVVEADLERSYDLAEDDWGPWRGEAALHWADALHLRADGEYAPDRDDPWLRWAALVEGEDRRGDRLFAGYRYLKEEASYADGGVTWVVTPVVSLRYRHRYSVRDHRTLEEAYAVGFAHPCWELEMVYTRHLDPDEDRDERRYFAVLHLEGLGRVGRVRGLFP